MCRGMYDPLTSNLCACGFVRNFPAFGSSAIRFVGSRVLSDTCPRPSVCYRRHTHIGSDALEGRRPCFLGSLPSLGQQSSQARTDPASLALHSGQIASTGSGTIATTLAWMADAPENRASNLNRVTTPVVAHIGGGPGAYAVDTLVHISKRVADTDHTRLGMVIVRGAHGR